MLYDFLNTPNFLKSTFKTVLCSLGLMTALALLRTDAAWALDTNELFRSGRSMPGAKSASPDSTPAMPLTTPFEKRAHDSVARNQALLDMMASQNTSSCAPAPELKK